MPLRLTRKLQYVFQTIVAYLLFLSKLENANIFFTVSYKPIAFFGVKCLTIICGRLKISAAILTWRINHFIMFIFYLPLLITFTSKEHRISRGRLRFDLSPHYHIVTKLGNESFGKKNYFGSKLLCPYLTFSHNISKPSGWLPGGLSSTSLFLSSVLCCIWINHQVDTDSLFSHCRIQIFQVDA